MSLSLLRVNAVCARPKAAFCSLQSGLASSYTHEEYPRESYKSPFWRNTVIVSLVAVVACKYAPEPGDNTYLTRWIALYKTPRESWLDINARHTARQQEASMSTILISDAKKEVAHRYRYPRMVNQSSPFLNGVGL